MLTLPVPLQQDQVVGIFRNFVLFGAVCVDLLPASTVRRLNAAIKDLDKRGVLRAQSWKEKPLMYSEFVKLGEYLADFHEGLARTRDLNEVMQRLIHKRWVQWHLLMASQPSRSSSVMLQVTSLSLFSIDFDRNLFPQLRTPRRSTCWRRCP